MPQDLGRRGTVERLRAVPSWWFGRGPAARRSCGSGQCHGGSLPAASRCSAGVPPGAGADRGQLPERHPGGWSLSRTQGSCTRGLRATHRSLVTYQAGGSCREDFARSIDESIASPLEARIRSLTARHPHRGLAGRLVRGDAARALLPTMFDATVAAADPLQPERELLQMGDVPGRQARCAIV